MTREINRDTLPGLYQTAFTRDHTSAIGARRMHISVVRAGTLYLPSGRLVACDPLLGKQKRPFIQTVLPGRYPVDLSLGQDTGDGIERIIFARVLITNKAPVVWVKALDEGADVRDASGDFGLLAKSGTIALMDLQTSNRIQLDTLTGLDDFLDKLVGNYRPKRSWYLQTFTEDHNALFFTSTVGDQPVPTYFAVDDAGDICLALTTLLS